MKRVNVYDCRSEAYLQAFQVFLDHTDQKTKTQEWLARLVPKLPSRQVFIDAGAGNGKVTSLFMDPFQQIIAIEPNPCLCDELHRTYPTAQVLPDTVLQAQPSTLDLVRIQPRANR
ncbi:MAG: hypothetical protein PHE55_13770 [Methylococcaceae bacterium]|nr:hypothetical protein [Methylococcaceae bacterium]